MNKLSSLTAYIESFPGIARDRMEAFADLGKLIPTGRDMGNGFEIGRFKYDAVISVYRCPASIAPLLLSAIIVWLGVNDPDRDKLELSDPDVDVTLEDEQTVFVQITVEFVETLELVEDAAGLITWNGKTWGVDAVDIDIAETLQKLDKA